MRTHSERLWKFWNVKEISNGHIIFQKVVISVWYFFFACTFQNFHHLSECVVKCGINFKCFSREELGYLLTWLFLRRNSASCCGFMCFMVSITTSGKNHETFLSGLGISKHLHYASILSLYLSFWILVSFGFDQPVLFCRVPCVAILVVDKRLLSQLLSQRTNCTLVLPWRSFFKTPDA